MGLIGACVIALRIHFGTGFSFVMFNVVICEGCGRLPEDRFEFC